MALRQHRIAEREDRDGGDRRGAADRARRDEVRRMLEGEDDIGGTGRGRQRRDQRADERAGALDGDRDDDDDERRQRHLQRQLGQKYQFGRHGCTKVRYAAA